MALIIELDRDEHGQWISIIQVKRVLVRSRRFAVRGSADASPSQDDDLSACVREARLHVRLRVVHHRVRDAGAPVAQAECFP